MLKVFCPVCDEPFKEESLLLQHLDLAHDLSLGGDRPRTVRVAADAADAEDWVVVEPGDDDEEQEAENHGGAAAHVDVTELSRWAVAKQLQSGCPPAELMRPLLLSLTGAASEFKRRGGLAWFEQSFALAFPNGSLPSEFFRLPLFGSTVDPDALRVELKRLLCVLAHHFPECNFCPVLVSLLQLSLDVVGLSEEEALALLSRLLREKETSLKRVDSRQAVSLVATSKSQVKLLATAVHKLVLGNVKGAPLSELRIEAADYALGWCTRFFEALLPRYRSHALCLWAAQGSSAVIRLAIGLVSAAAAKASPAARADKSRFLAHMDAWQGGMRDEEWAEVLRKSYKVRKWFLRDAKIRAISAVDAAAVKLEDDMVVSATYFRPVACGSILEREEQWDLLWSVCVPERFRQQHPTLLYSAAQGWSWKKLLKALLNQPRVIITLRSAAGSVFGALLVRGFERGKEGVFVADREAQLFDLSRMRAHCWRFGREDYVAQWTSDRLCVGCDHDGRVALTLDASLEHAQLDACNVFGCEGPLAAEGERAALVKLEVYRF